jgi:hypothetical protein
MEKKSVANIFLSPKFMPVSTFLGAKWFFLSSRVFLYKGICGFKTRGVGCQVSGVRKRMIEDKNRNFSLALTPDT